MKGIVLAAGVGSRLWPITFGVSKQLLPVYDKPLVHYPIGTLMLAGIREILIITTKFDQPAFKKSLGYGENIGISIQYEIQEVPGGIAQSFLIGEKFIEEEEIALILGDNIFYGQGLGAQLRNYANIQGAHIFAYKVSDPQRFGVVEFDNNGIATSLEEKPSIPKSSFAVPGLYFYDNSVIDKAKIISPSSRGELEITSINNLYLQEKSLSVTVLERGTAWLDTGTFDSLNSASSFIKTIEDRQGLKISCLEEISWRNGWITDSELLSNAKKYSSSPYGKYLYDLINH